MSEEKALNPVAETAVTETAPAVVVEAEAAAKKEAFIPDLFEMFAVDKRLAIEGAPMKLGQTTFQVARATSRKFQNAIQAGYLKLFDKFPEDKRDTTEYQDAVEHMVRNALADFILLGWDVLKYKGKIYKGYDRKLAYELLGMEDFQEVVSAFSSNRKNFLPDLSTEEAKN